MALWKPFRGSRDNLDTVDKHDGYIYFCIDDGSLFFDYTDASGVLQRKQITVQEAEKLLTPMNVTIGKKTVSVDGSTDVSFPLYEIMGSVETPSSGNSNKGKWVKFANINLPSAWNVCSGILNFAKTEGLYGAEGILSFYFRNGSSTSATDISLSWISLNNENWAESVAAVQVSNGNFDLYYQPVKDYETVLVTAINIYNPSRLTFGTDSYVDTITAEEVSVVRSYAKSANSAAMLQTYKPGSTTETYGEQYPLMAQWEDSDTLRLYSEDSVVKVDYAEQAGNVPTTEEIATIADARINAYDILSRLDALEYVPIAINTFSNNVGTVELGRTITSVTFNWTTNKTPTTLKLGSTVLSSGATSYTLSGQSITSNTAYTLTASDGQNTVTKTTNITFLNGVYYGAAASGDINSAFILALSKTLQSSKGKTFSATTGSGQYIWYAVPTRYGTCSFNVGGFDGGFSLVDTISFTNASNYTETYYVYRSDNANLGTQTVKVS